jgi:hypothetical protein
VAWPCSTGYRLPGRFVPATESGPAWRGAHEEARRDGRAYAPPSSATGASAACTAGTRRGNAWHAFACGEPRPQTISRRRSASSAGRGSISDAQPAENAGERELVPVCRCPQEGVAVRANRARAVRVMRGTWKAQAQRTQSSAVRRTVLGCVLRASPDKRPRRAGGGVRRRLQAAPGRAASLATRPHRRHSGHRRSPRLPGLGPHPNRERFYRQHIEPGRWLRVVVDYGQDPAWVVTAVEQVNDPRMTS